MTQVMDFDALHDVLPGKHFYQFYKGADDYLRIMASYFGAGLGKKQACLLLVSKKIGVERAINIFRSTIPQVLTHLGERNLVIQSAEDWYLTDERFDPEKALGNLNQHLSKSKEEGYEVLRMAGDAGAIPRVEWPELFEYERQANVWLRSQPVIALCAYPIMDCVPSHTKEVLKCHADVLVGSF